MNETSVVKIVSLERPLHYMQQGRLWQEIWWIASRYRREEGGGGGGCWSLHNKPNTCRYFSRSWKDLKTLKTSLQTDRLLIKWQEGMKESTNTVWGLFLSSYIKFIHSLLSSLELCQHIIIFSYNICVWLKSLTKNKNKDIIGNNWSFFQVRFWISKRFTGDKPRIIFDCLRNYSFVPRRQTQLPWNTALAQKTGQDI